MENGSLKSFEASNGHKKSRCQGGQEPVLTCGNLPYGLSLTAKTFENLWLNLVQIDYLQEFRLQLDVDSNPSPV